MKFERKAVMSRTKNSLRNIKYGITFQIISLLLSFFARRVFVMVLSQEYLGLDGTFSNILSLISLTELGIGSAITYCLYKPLAVGDEEQTVALMVLFRRVYRTIGVVVAAMGAALLPFLPLLIRELPDIPYISLIYLLFVADSAVSYFYSYKSTLFIADQKKYIVTVCNYMADILRQICQMLFLWHTKNYFFYLAFKLGATLLKNLLISHQADRHYPFLAGRKSGILASETKKSILINTKALIIHKISNVIVFGTDNLLLSFFEGVVAVGLYSNYLVVTRALNTIYLQIFQSITASVGNLGVTESSEKALTVYKRVNFAGSWIYGFSAVCLVILFNPFIELWVGKNYQFGQWIVCLIALNFYVTGMRQVTIIFREAYGMYWYDRYKAVAEAVINLVASVVLAGPFGVAGIFMGTFISTMTTCFWVEPLVLFRHGLHAPVRIYFREYGINTLVTLLMVGIVWYMCLMLPGRGIVLFLEKMAVCAVVGNLGYLTVYRKREELKYFVDLAAGLISKNRKKGKTEA